jgi:hypothetical protein
MFILLAFRPSFGCAIVFNGFAEAHDGRSRLSVSIVYHSQCSTVRRRVAVSVMSARPRFISYRRTSPQTRRPPSERTGTHVFGDGWRVGCPPRRPSHVIRNAIPTADLGTAVRDAICRVLAQWNQTFGIGHRRQNTERAAEREEIDHAECPARHDRGRTFSPFRVASRQTTRWSIGPHVARARPALTVDLTQTVRQDRPGSLCGVVR